MSRPVTVVKQRLVFKYVSLTSFGYRYDCWLDDDDNINVIQNLKLSIKGTIEKKKQCTEKNANDS